MNVTFKKALLGLVASLFLYNQTTLGMQQQSAQHQAPRVQSTQPSTARLVATLGLGLAEGIVTTYLTTQAMSLFDPVNSLLDESLFTGAGYLAPCTLALGSYGLQKLAEYKERLSQIRTGKPSAFWSHTKSFFSSAKSLIVQSIIAHGLGSYLSRFYQATGSTAATTCNALTQLVPATCSYMADKAANTALTVASLTTTHCAEQLLSDHSEPQLRVTKSSLIPPPCEVKQFIVRKQEGHSCGLHAVHNLRCFMQGTDEIDIERLLSDDTSFPEITTKCTFLFKTTEDLHGDQLSQLLIEALKLPPPPKPSLLTKKLVVKALQLLRILKKTSVPTQTVTPKSQLDNVTIIDDPTVLDQLCTGTANFTTLNATKGMSNLLEKRDSFNASDSQPQYFLVNTRGHWLPFKFIKKPSANGGVQVFTADSFFNQTGTGNKAITAIYHFLTNTPIAGPADIPAPTDAAAPVVGTQLEGPQVTYFLASYGCDIEQLWHRFLSQAHLIRTTQEGNWQQFCAQQLVRLSSNITRAFAAAAKKLPTTLSNVTDLVHPYMPFGQYPQQFTLDVKYLKQERPSFSCTVTKEPQAIFDGIRQAVLSYFAPANLHIRNQRGDEAIFNCPLPPIFIKVDEEQVSITAYPQSRQDLLYPNQWEATTSLPTWFTVASKTIPYALIFGQILCKKSSTYFTPDGTMCTLHQGRFYCVGDKKDFETKCTSYESCMRDRLVTPQQRALITLELDPQQTYSLQKIKKRYHELSPKQHPDKHGNNTKMVEINLAYDFLKKQLSTSLYPEELS